MRNVFMCNCGTGFTLEESATIYEDGLPVTACPHCKSANIEEGDQCRVCGTIDWPWKMKHGVCEHCFNDAVSTYGNLDVTEE